MTIDREELRRLCEAATPGPWTLDLCDEEIGFIHAGIAWIVPKDSAAFSGPYFIQAKTEDAAFIASARTAVPALLDALEAAEATLEKVRIQLAACGVIAMSNTPDSTKDARAMLPEYDCASIHDVSDAVDREMAAREALKAAEAREKRLREVGHEMADKLTVLVKFGPHDATEKAAAIRALEMFSAALAETAP